MKKIFYFLLFLGFLVGLGSCKNDRIDHEDSEHIYVWKYKLNGDSSLYTYHQPVFYKKVVTDKKIRCTSHYHGVPGKGGHRKTTCKYLVYYGKEEVVHRALYDNVEIGDTVEYIEKFYPTHKVRVFAIYNKNLWKNK